MNTFVVCLNNSGYEASLERHKIYRALEDSAALEKHGQIRIVDESGEDYLYPATRFIALAVPSVLEKELLRAA
jgi:hypothetical protein